MNEPTLEQVKAAVPFWAADWWRGVRKQLEKLKDSEEAEGLARLATWLRRRDLAVEYLRLLDYQRDEACDRDWYWLCHNLVYFETVFGDGPLYIPEAVASLREEDLI